MTNPFAKPQTATARLHAGRARGRLDVAISPAGLLAIGGLVGVILLGVVPIVRAAGKAKRDAASE